jgi:3-oxoacyl-[acyl-carrier-protein] synthase II
LDDARQDLPPERLGVNVGAGLGGLPEIQSVHNDFKEKGFRRITPFFILQVIANITSGQLSVLLNLKGPNHCEVTACATSTHSIGESYRLIQCGEADVMIAGGAESVVCELGIGGFTAMKALSQRNDDPTKASRPFDRDRDGFVMGEGATVLVLEEYERAKARGAKIYGEVVGYGGHVGRLPPDVTRAGSGRCGDAPWRTRFSMRVFNPHRSITSTPHATSTPAGDSGEATAIARVLGGGRKIPLAVSSTKSMTGHMLGAAGSTEALICLLSMRDQMIPPTTNLENLDPVCEGVKMNFVPQKNAIGQVEIRPVQ